VSQNNSGRTRGRHPGSGARAHEYVAVLGREGAQRGELGCGEVGVVGDPHGAVLEGVHGVLVGDRCGVVAAVLVHRGVVAADGWVLRVGDRAGDVVARQACEGLDSRDGRLGCRVDGRVLLALARAITVIVARVRPRSRTPTIPAMSMVRLRSALFRALVISARRA
jgi:hypothetical protein